MLVLLVQVQLQSCCCGSLVYVEGQLLKSDLGFACVLLFSSCCYAPGSAFTTRACCSLFA